MFQPSFKDGWPGQRQLFQPSFKDGWPGQRQLFQPSFKDGWPGQRQLFQPSFKDGWPGQRQLQGLPRAIKTNPPDVVFYYIKVIQIQAYDSEECRNVSKFILKLHSELSVFNLGGSVFQVEDPEKAKLVLNWSIRGRGKT